MFNLLKRTFDRSQQREIDEYLLILRGMDENEIGGVVALAAHMRNRYLEGKGLDFLEPYTATLADDSIVVNLVNVAKGFQKQGQIGLINAAAAMAWIHTLRASINPNLRVKAREMWGELSRGFSHIEEGAEMFKILTGEVLDLRDAGTYPGGFTPEPT